MKKIIQYVALVLSLVFAYLIYESVTAPMHFKKVKVERYAEVINALKIIKKSEDAHKTIIGNYSGDFEQLIKFIDTAQFIITQQRDTSWVEYDKHYRIDMLKEGTVIDTLGYVSVKDSLFKDSDKYKTMMNVPNIGGHDLKFELKTSKIEKAGISLPVYKASVAKERLLDDQPKSLIRQENEVEGFDEINGSYIILGSLDEVSSNGNWPSIYDANDNK